MPLFVSIDIPLTNQVLAMAFYNYHFLVWQKWDPKLARYRDIISVIRCVVIDIENKTLSVSKQSHELPLQVREYPEKQPPNPMSLETFSHHRVSNPGSVERQSL